MRVVKSYGVDEVIGYITTDKGSSNDTIMRGLEEVHHLTGFQQSQCRIRCFGHVINLAVQSLLFAQDQDAAEEAIRQNQATTKRLGEEPITVSARQFRRLGPLGKAHNFVLFIYSSE